MSASVGKMLVEALALVLYAMDHVDEDLIDLETIVHWEEAVGSLIVDLAPEDRRELLAMVQRLAAETADEQMRLAYLAFIEYYGLDDEDGD
jgi:DNA-directed RNA polymerase subunit F